MIEPSDIERAELPETSAQYIQDLEGRIDSLEDALHKIRNWCMAYPVDVFIPPTDAQVKASVDAMKSPGCASSGAMHGAWARHILDGLVAHTNIINQERDDC